MLFATIDPALQQTYWAMGIMAAGFLICAFAGAAEWKSRTIKVLNPSIWRADKWHIATVTLGIIGIGTWFGGLLYLVNR